MLHASAVFPGSRMTEEHLKWTTDAQGNRVLRGLTHEETTFLLRQNVLDTEYRFKARKLESSEMDEYREGKRRRIELRAKHSLEMFKARGARTIT